MSEIEFVVCTGFAHPGLHIWGPEGFRLDLFSSEPDAHDPRWRVFRASLPRPRAIGIKLFERRTEADRIPESWEPHERGFEPNPGEPWPERIWLCEGSDRVMTRSPQRRGVGEVTIHLVTARRYLEGELYVWRPGAEGRRIAQSGPPDALGPVFRVPVQAQSPWFNFKFLRKDERFEPDYANRTWSAADGPEVWTHSEGAAVLSEAPERGTLSLHVGHGWGDVPLWLHVWQGSSDYADTVAGETDADAGFTSFRKEGLYTGIPYGLLLTRNPPDVSQEQELREDDAVRRSVVLRGAAELWTLEGSPTLFAARPVAETPVEVAVAPVGSAGAAATPTALEVRVDRAGTGFDARTQQLPDGRWRLFTYPGVVTAFAFSGPGFEEQTWHRLSLPLEGAPPGGARVMIVPGRRPLLLSAPPAPLFADPPVALERPGVVIGDDGIATFALHAPWCARVRLQGDWMAEGELVDLQSTRDGAFWWLRLPSAALGADAPPERPRFHGRRYRYLLNDLGLDPLNRAVSGAKVVQDPAADWVVDSAPSGWSRLVEHARFPWTDGTWRRPGWEYYTIYQLHASRFTRRNRGDDGQPLLPFAQVVAELEREDGHLRALDIGALLLLPVSEFSGAQSWGYDPSYFYAVENAYGGPEGLKRLVDACHRRGLAVLLDVEFNHLGTGHNILWEVCRESFIDGDTKWGSLVNFDHPQCTWFFQQNLVHFMRNYHIDGFRFDHTKTIIDGHTHYDSIRVPGSGGGWEFLHALRRAARDVDPRVLFMAEQLPNDPALTNLGGSMDTQWCDDFHDRILELCRGEDARTQEFARALRYSHTGYDNWYSLTQYAESHDEVGNTRDRVAFVAGYGKGLRTAKVAAAALLFSRGLPMFFMGQEAGETAQFRFGRDDTLELDAYRRDEGARGVLAWWQELLALRSHNPKLQGPAPLRIHHEQGGLVAFSRGDGAEFFVVCNFNGGSAWKPLWQLQLPQGVYRELYNSTWPPYQVEGEAIEDNGWDAHVDRGQWLHIPDRGAIVLERV